MQQPSRPGNEELSRFRQTQPAAASLEERRPQFLLKGLDLVTHSGLTEMKQFGCFREVQTLGRLQKSLYTLNVNHHDSFTDTAR